MEDNVLRDKSDGFALRVIKMYLKNKFQPFESLELVTGTPANFWNKLEAQYQEQLAKVQERKL
jgi:hypothetical protein